MVRAGSDADGGRQTNGVAGHIRSHVTVVGDAARRGHHANIPCPGVQTRKQHALGRFVTDVAARGHRRGVGVHCECSVLGLDINSACATSGKVAGRGLSHALIGDHAEAARNGGHNGIHKHILVVQCGCARLEEHVAGAARGDGLRHGQRAVQREHHDVAACARR